MSHQNPQDWEQRLKDLEAEINGETEPIPVRPFYPNEEAQGLFVKVQNWYQGLATPAKVGVAIVGVFLSLSLLNGILRLVSSLIAIGILGVVLYGVYKAFLANKSSQ
jgi:hypothetical protein